MNDADVKDLELEALPFLQNRSTTA